MSVPIETPMENPHPCLPCYIRFCSGRPWSETTGTSAPGCKYRATPRPVVFSGAGGARFIGVPLPVLLAQMPFRITWCGWDGRLGSTRCLKIQRRLVVGERDICLLVTLSRSFRRLRRLRVER